MVCNHVSLLPQLRQPERLSQPLNLLTRLNRFVRVIEERVNRGATQVSLEICAYLSFCHFATVVTFYLLLSKFAITELSEVCSRISNFETENCCSTVTQHTMNNSC